jgi:sugar lactone lactonase YvrE
MNQISVYDTTTFQILYTISVAGATNFLYGLALSPTNNYLYVSDKFANKVFRVDLSSVPSNNPQVESWSVAYGPNGLSVNSQLNVLVAADSRKIQEYTPNGTLVREVTLNAQLYQAVEVNSGTWAVSHKIPYNNVCLMSINGTVLYCTATGLLKKPASIAVDSQGYVLVADSGNNRIVVLSPTLSDARTLPLPIDPPDQINYPLSLWLDEARCRLYVGESFDTNRLLVYDNVCNLGDAFTP